MINLDKSSYTVSIAENDLLISITEVKYGEVFNIEVPDAPPEVQVVITDNQRLLIDFIREGNRKIDTISVHEGQPVSVEVISIIRGYRCVKKIRL